MFLFLKQVYTIKLQLNGCQYDKDGRCMEMNVNMSDWVHGRTAEGEMVYGFVESVDGLQGLVTLYVVKSDNDEREGKLATVRISTVKIVADIDSEDLRHADDLIDLALATRDEAWFLELTKGIEADQPAEAFTELDLSTLAPYNRLGKIVG